MHRLLRFAVPVLGIVLAAGCATPGAAPPRFCSSAAILVEAAFPGGNFHECTVNDDATISIIVRPEDEPPINRSPWYAFRVHAGQPLRTRVQLSFVDGYPRYWPKTSRDGSDWTPLEADRVTVDDDADALTLDLDIGELPLWIAAQELVLPDTYDRWLRELAALPGVALSIAGHSIEGRPIGYAATARKPEVIYLFGRQHPPEVTGALAMRRFIDTVFADTELARTFRERFMLVVLPLINPDGVVAGHWRHNLGGVDLNRDWGPFTQPETRGIADMIASNDAAGSRPVLMLDFHSTMSSLFYTQMPGELPGAEDFATTWLTRSRARLEGFEFTHEPRAPSGQDNTKNYFFATYGIPAITYEIGDEVDRDAIDWSTPVFAEELMRLMLER